MLTARLICRYFVNLFWSADVRPSQFALGVASILWSVMLFWPGNTFERQTYAAMAEIANEYVWGGAFLAVGTVNLYNVVSAFWKPWPRLVSRFDAFLTFLVWSAAVVSIIVAQSPPPAAIAGEIALAGAAFWIFVRTDLPILKRKRITDAK